MLSNGKLQLEEVIVGRVRTASLLRQNCFPRESISQANSSRDKLN